MKLIDSVVVRTEIGPIEIEFYDNGFIKIGDFWFSQGFRSLSYRKRHLWNYTRTQAAIIEWMFDYLQTGFQSVHQYELIRKLEDRRYSDDENECRNVALGTRRLRDFFKVSRGKIHPSFGSFLKTTKGRDSKICFDFSWKPNS